MGTTFYFEWEVVFMEWFQSVWPAVMTKLAIAFTLCGEQTVLIVVMGFLYWCYDKRFGRFVGVNILTCTVLNPMIKNVFLRKRPYFDNTGIKCLKAVEEGEDLLSVDAQGYSFPSGHSMSSVTVYGSLPVYKKNKTLTVIAIVMPILVGISRVYVGCHYPTDVMAGWILGALVVLVVSYLQRKVKKAWILYVILMLLGLPGVFYCNSSDYFTCYGLMIGGLSAFLFEEKFVKFENTKSIPRMILRVAGGGIAYLILNVLMKLPFSSDFLSSGSLASHLVRMFRYAIIGFVLIAIYPMVFRYTAGIGKKKEA